MSSPAEWYTVAPSALTLGDRRSAWPRPTKDQRSAPVDMSSAESVWSSRAPRKTSPACALIAGELRAG